MTSVTVKAEPRTYDRGGGDSYFADLIAVTVPGHRYEKDAWRRLLAHAGEVRVEAKTDTPEGRRMRRALLNEARSTPMGAHRVREELRAMTTSPSSAGAFVVPQYLVEDTAPYRTYGRAFVDQANVLPLADTGMEVYLPAVGSPAQVAAALTQTSGVSELDPSASYLSSAVETAAGQVTASQQLIDRQQDGTADTAIQAQLTMAYNTSLDAAVTAAAIAAGGTGVTDSGTLSIANIWNDVAKAKAQMQTTQGTVLPGTHTFFPPLIWNWITAQVDGEERPIILPEFPPAAGPEGTWPEGDCGYAWAGSRAFQDGNLPLTSGNATVLACHMPEVWVFEGEPIMRAYPETLAGTLSVVLERYSYWALIIRYPQACQAISGAAYTPNPSI